MVNSSCGAAIACYTLPLLACWFYSIQSIRNVKLLLLQRFEGTSTPQQPSNTNDPATAEMAKPVKVGQWPMWSLEFAKPSIGLFIWCCFPMFGYGVIRGFSDCDQYGWFCWTVEDQSTESHLRNLLHLLSGSIVLAWLCKVPPSKPQHRALFVAVACCEFLTNKFVWKNCEEFMAHSLSTDSTFGSFDIFIAMTTMLTLLILMCEGLPSLRRCFYKLFRMTGVTVGEPNPEVHLNFRGQCHYLIYVFLVILFHGFLFIAFSDDFHMHHYWVGFIVASGCIFPTPLSRLMMLKSVAGHQT